DVTDAAMTQRRQVRDRELRDRDVIDVVVGNVRHAGLRADDEDRLALSGGSEGADFLAERIHQEIAVAFVAHIFSEAQEDEIDVERIGGAVHAFEDLPVVIVGERRFAMEEQSDASAGERVAALEIALVDESPAPLRSLEHAAGDQLLKGAMR